MERSTGEDPIEAAVKKAQEEGAFDALPGKGKPFTHLDTDPLGNVLAAQGFAARWMELDQEIRDKTADAERAVNRSYAWAAAHVDRASARAEWRKARRIFRERLEEINGLIRLYNLQVPPTVGQRFILTEADELKRLGLPDELD